MERLGWTDSTDPQIETLLKLTYDGFRRTYSQVSPPSQDQIILREDIPIGLLIVLHFAAEIRLADISLLPDYRNQGIGTHCLQSLLHLAREKKLPVRLRTAAGNDAQRLYLRIGFIVTKVDELDQEMEWKQ